MNYSSDAIKKAQDELIIRRQTAIAVQASRVKEISEKYPEAYKIYSEIASTRQKLADVILSRTPDAHAEIEKIRLGNIELQASLSDTLVSLGYPGDYLRVHYTCPICSDSGVKDGKRCHCMTELLNRFSVEELNRLCVIKLGSFAEFDLSYYPEEYTYGGSKYSPREIMKSNLKYCIDYSKRFPNDCPSLFMLGKTGLGKTYLSGCIAREVQAKGMSAAFDLAPNYLREIEKEHFGRSEGDTLSTILNADLLILDDLGSELPSAFNSAAVYNILNSRLNMGKPTIVSTNLSLDELSKRYDDRIMSRLMGMFKTLRFMGEDIRQIKRRQGQYL